MIRKTLITYPCKILSVVDGDTLTAEIDLGFRIKYKTYIRLKNVLAPELHDKGAIIPKVLNANGQKCKEYLQSLIPSPLESFTVISHELDKYGRCLGDLIDPRDININDKMIDFIKVIEGKLK